MHTCSALVVSCIDFRIQTFVEEWAKKHLGERQYDRVSWAGGVLDWENISRQLDISVRLHAIKKVVLMNHEDCGAYGKDGTQERHIADLKRAEAVVKEKYPDLFVETYIVSLDGTVRAV